ncbi:MAG TPA: AAA family ATPase [Acidimicrobiales bacterium]
MAVEITIVGEVGARCAGEAAVRRLAGAHPRTALAVLAIERPHGVRREDLADVIWPEGPPATWDSALRTVISRVRRFLASALGSGDDPVLARQGRYYLRLPDGTTIDVEVAEDEVVAARRALSSGDLATARAAAESAALRLAGDVLPGAAGRWVDHQRGRLRDLAVDALEVTSEAALAAGDTAGALAAATRAADGAPLRESAHRLQMAAHAAAGNRAEALGVFQRLRRGLVEDFGVDPSPETNAAYLALLGGAPDTERPAPPLSAAPPARPARPAPRGPLPFVGRERELGVLADAWRDAKAGNRLLVLLSGEPGIGKTRLATEAARRVSVDDGLVLFGRCDEQALVPYQPFVEALDAYVAATPVGELPPLGDHAFVELAALLPSLHAPARPGARGDRAALFDATSDLVASIAAERSLLLVLDDLHWADDDTLLLVRHVLRGRGRRPILVIATSRDDAPGGPPGDVLQGLDHEGALRRLPLAGLSEGDVRVLLRETLGTGRRDHAALARRLLAETAGNPFLLGELLRAEGGAGVAPAIPAGAGAGGRAAGSAAVGAGGEPGPVDQPAAGPVGGPAAGPTRQEPDLPIPPAVAELVAARLAPLLPAAVDLLRAGAVVGMRFDLALAADTARLSEDETLDALDEALATGLLVEETAERYRFQHDIVRRALEAQLSGARRRALHRRLADAIERARPTASAHAAALAHHAAAGAAAGGDRRAVHWACVAAEQAASRAAFAEAVRLYRRALQHIPESDRALEAGVTTDLGITLARAGDPRAESTLIDGAILARRHDRPEVLARAALHLADLGAGRSAPAVEALHLVELALAATAPTPPGTTVDDRDSPAPGAGPDGTRLLHARLLVRRHRLRGVTGAAADGAVPRHALDALTARLTWLAGPDHLDERLVLADELATLAALADDASGKLVAAHERATVAAIGHDQPALEAALRSLAAVVADDGDPLVRALLAERRAAACVEEGRFADALAAVDGASTACAAMGRDPAAVRRRHLPVIRWLGWTPAAPDGTASADGTIGGDGTVSGHRPPGGAPRGPEARGADATDALELVADGEHARARIVLRELVAGLRPLPEDDRRLHDLGVLAFAVAELGDPSLVAGTRRLLARHADLRCGDGYLSFAGSAAFHLGRLAALEGAWADAERHFLVALRRHATVPARPWVALTQAALADVLEARGRPSDREWISALRSEANWVIRSLGLRRPSPLAGSGT